MNFLNLILSIFISAQDVTISNGPSTDEIVKAGLNPKPSAEAQVITYRSKR